jgi:hypothetical protein
MHTPQLTHDYLESVLRYDITTGEFIRLRTSRVTGRINDDGYLEIQVGKKRFLAHRLAWFWVYGQWPDHPLDHINRVKTDNRISNLRYITASQQNQNTDLHPNNTSGYRGVFLDRRSGKWRARIRVNNVKYSLGSYPTPEEAYAAYLKAVPVYHTHNPLLDVPKWLLPA